jgi:hypothetical protein
MDPKAFPTEVGPGVDGGFQSGNERWHEPGMSLRDYFAGQELAKVDAVSVCDIPSAYARLADHCYRMADAMLEARTE